MSALTSRIAVHPEVRQRLVALQQEFLRRHGGVMEGRDIGTVVVPQTPFKFFLDAAHEVRADRRHAELRSKGPDPGRDEVARHLADRDARDSSREESPMQAAPDAFPIDTGTLGPDEVVETMLAEIRRLSATGAR